MRLNFTDSSGAPRPVVNSKGRRRRPGSKSLAQVLKCEDEQFIDFIAKCLIFDPDRRYALSDWIQKYHLILECPG